MTRGEGVRLYFCVKAVIFSGKLKTDVGLQHASDRGNEGPNQHSHKARRAMKAVVWPEVGRTGLTR